MGSVLHPVGSLPPSAYWLRRLVALLVVVLVLMGAWWLIGGFGGTGGSGSPGATGAGTTSGSPAPTTSSPSASTSHSSTASASTSKSASTSAPPALCPDSAIKVLALTAETTYPAGKPAKLTVEVTNHGAVACKRDVGQAALELVVSSGSTRIWSSDDCNPGGGHAVVTLRAGQTFSTTVTWARQRSAVGCPSGQPLATPGHYTLVARNLTLKSAPTPFALA